MARAKAHQSATPTSESASDAVAAAGNASTAAVPARAEREISAVATRATKRAPYATVASSRASRVALRRSSSSRSADAGSADGSDDSLRPRTESGTGRSSSSSTVGATSAIVTRPGMRVDGEVKSPPNPAPWIAMG